MCTVVVLRRPGHAWPLVLGANRDEMTGRASAPPARHWPDRPHATGGLDRLAGGTWLAVGDQGVVTAVMNRVGSLGPAPGMRSRGDLPLIALDHPSAAEAAEHLAGRRAGLYRPFNLIVADRTQAFWLARREADEAIACAPLPEGLSMLTAHDLNDPTSRRIRHFLPRFRAAAAPDPSRNHWGDWPALLGSLEHAPDGGPTDAMTIRPQNGFATVSSSLVALGGPAGAKPLILWNFADGSPDSAPFSPVAGLPAALRD
jgi:transport and Golgi organization protein 2